MLGLIKVMKLDQRVSMMLLIINMYSLLEVGVVSYYVMLTSLASILPISSPCYTLFSNLPTKENASSQPVKKDHNFFI